MRVLFKATTTKDDDGWLMASCGHSSIDEQDWIITTQRLHADEVPEDCQDAKTFAELVARLLNEFYNKP
jgi:hypothetical protein